MRFETKAICCIVFIALVVLTWIIARALRRRNISLTGAPTSPLSPAEQNWITARHNRIRWRNDHLVGFGFDHWEYQQLWGKEILAERILMDKSPNNYHTNWTSWGEYQRQEEEYRQSS